MGGLIAIADGHRILDRIEEVLIVHHRFRLRPTDERWVLQKQDWQLETVCDNDR